jgi:hypothetical protein
VLQEPCARAPRTGLADRPLLWHSLQPLLAALVAVSCVQGTMASVPVSPHGTSRLPKGNVLMAVPKKGRLYEKVVKVLEGAGLEYRRVRATQLSTSMAE